MTFKREQSNAAISYHLIHTICQRPVNSIKSDYLEVKGGISGQIPLFLPDSKPLPLATIWREDLFRQKNKIKMLL